MANRKEILIIVDADAIVAQVNIFDSNHAKALAISQKINRLKARVIYPLTAIVEAVTVLQRKLDNKSAAYATASAFTNLKLQIAKIDFDIYSKAVNNYFKPGTSKKNTLFDCIVAALAEKHQADAIFSFDKFYKKRGFKLTSELK